MIPREAHSICSHWEWGMFSPRLGALVTVTSSRLFSVPASAILSMEGGVRCPLNPMMTYGHFQEGKVYWCD